MRDGIVAYLLSREGKTVTAADLRVGDCIDEPPDGPLPFLMRRVDCDSAHEGEVHAVMQYPDAPHHPDETAMQNFQDNCGAEFARYAPNLPAGPTFGRLVIYPTPESWANGDRSFVCIATTDQHRSQSLRT